MNKSIAILITVFNRRNKTLACLRSIQAQKELDGYHVDIFIVDGGSKDGTPESIKEEFPEVHVSIHEGLFWAGGMRQAWKEALEYRQDYDYFWLLNDDTTLFPMCFHTLIDAEKEFPGGIYVGATCDANTKEYSYGGIKLYNHNNSKGEKVIPNGHYQKIDMGNANIMLVSRNAYNLLGSFCPVYTHGIADFDYTLRAINNNIPVRLAPDYCGECYNDHGKNWLSPSHPLKERIKYLYSPKGLAYKEYLYWIKTFFPKEYLSAKLKLWGKTLFPTIWEKLK